ncbi:MAG TPA: hypothetical protein VE641_12110 [Chthoniobacterales bacterium]|jgi:hypothetical protein|nr:hypothetical protein [Chthoniobacterales bacterium]
MGTNNPGNLLGYGSAGITRLTSGATSFRAQLSRMDKNEGSQEFTDPTGTKELDQVNAPIWH